MSTEKKALSLVLVSIGTTVSYTAVNGEKYPAMVISSNPNNAATLEVFGQGPDQERIKKDVPMNVYTAMQRHTWEYLPGIPGSHDYQLATAPDTGKSITFHFDSAQSPLKGQLWKSKEDEGIYRVAVDPVEGYVIARQKTGMLFGKPLVYTLEEWRSQFVPHATPQR